MKSVIWTAYGPPSVLQLEEREKPVPGDREILVRIHSASVTAGDCEMRGMKLALFVRLPMRLFVGFKKPSRIPVLGMELSGTVEAAGRQVRLFGPGDRILATTGVRFGAYSEYICLPEEPGEMDGPVAKMPENVSFDEAAVLPNGGLEALHFIRKARLEKGKTILINGACGSIGTFALQLAKLAGAHVTAVDSAEKHETLTALGADAVIDYRVPGALKDSGPFDALFDIAGSLSHGAALRRLKKGGVLLVANPTLNKMMSRVPLSLLSGRTIVVGAGNQDARDLKYLADLLHQGKLKSVIDRIYPLEEVVKAHEYVESGAKSGHVVLHVAPAANGIKEL